MNNIELADRIRPMWQLLDRGQAFGVDATTVMCQLQDLEKELRTQSDQEAKE